MPIMRQPAKTLISHSQWRLEYRRKMREKTIHSFMLGK
jgi:hypothetical protein